MLKDSHQSSNLKLLRIELPKFSGEVLKFQNFWDQFEAAAHDNDDLPNVQKFTYPSSVLTGNALQTIEGFEVTGANYQPAVEYLPRLPKAKTQCGRRVSYFRFINDWMSLSAFLRKPMPCAIFKKNLTNFLMDEHFFS